MKNAHKWPKTGESWTQTQIAAFVHRSRSTLNQWKQEGCILRTAWHVLFFMVVTGRIDMDDDWRCALLDQMQANLSAKEQDELFAASETWSLTNRL